MTLRILTILVLLLGCACAAPAVENADDKGVEPKELQGTNDLKADASTYIRRYSDWSGYPGNNYNNYATGYGLLDDKYSTYNGGYNGYNAGFSGYSGYNGYASNGNGYGYKGYGGYDSGIGYGGQNTLASGGYGGYGGYGGNGGLTSYTGYNNPYYTGAYHLGYGYRKPGYENIYNSGITPSLVTGYRGYSKR